jgi:hypothetical protein
MIDIFIDISFLYTPEKVQWKVKLRKTRRTPARPS